MKKTIIALMGLFTLSACSEDVYQEADKMNETGTVENNSGGMQTNSYDQDLPGSPLPPFQTNNYESPYLWQNSTGSVEYHFINNTPNAMVITPSVGLYVYGQPSDPYFGSYLTNPSNYPNLFAGGNQYGNTIALDPIIIPSGSSLMHGPSTAGLPINGATFGSGFAYASSNITTHEVMAMMEIGKMHHLRYALYDRRQDPKGGVPYATGELKQRVGDDNATNVGTIPNNWHYITNFSGNSNLAFMANMGSGTRGELCLVNHPNTPIVPSQVVITDPLGATFTLSYTTDRNNVYVIFQ